MNAFDLSRIPLGQPPPGEESNLIDPPSRAWMPQVAIYTTLPTTFLFILLRLYARFSRSFQLGWDDYLSISAMAASAGFCGILLAQVTDEIYGRHRWDVPLSAMTDVFMQQTCAITAMYCWAAALTKVSLCALFLRIFSPLKRNLFLWSGVVFIVVSYVTIFAVWIAYSVPGVRYSGWTNTVFLTRVSEDTPVISVVLSVLSIVTDFYILAIPLYAVSGLNLSTNKKFGVSALFATGFVACAFCVAGLPPRIRNYQATVSGTHDPFWTSMPSYGLAVAEINLGIICACLPVCAPLFRSMTTQLSSAGSSWRRNLLKSSKSSESSPTFGHRAGVPGAALPTVPKGNLRTLLSFFQKSQGTQQSASDKNITVTSETDIGITPYSELRSVDMEYHSYLSTYQTPLPPAYIKDNSTSG